MISNIHVISAQRPRRDVRQGRVAERERCIIQAASMVKHTKAKVDFSQKRVKVGRKLPKSLSETQIDVKARKLVIPSQKQITTHVDQGNQQEVLSSHMVSDHSFASFSSPLLLSCLVLSCPVYYILTISCSFTSTPSLETIEPLLTWQ